MEESNIKYIEEEEITLKELIFKVIEFGKELIRYWWIMVLVFIVAAAYLIHDMYTTETVYPANLTFMLNDDGGDSGGGLGLVLGSLGISGGKKKGGNLEKILQLFKTRVVIDQALLTKVDINGKSDYLVNHIIDDYTLDVLLERYGNGTWAKKIKEEDNHFRMKDDTVNTQAEQYFMKIMYDYIIGNSGKGLVGFMSSKLDEDSGIMSVHVSTESEDLTIAIINTVYERLSLFFIEKAIEKQKKTYDILLSKRDSISAELAISEYELADFKDSNRNLVTVKGYLKESHLTRQVKILNVMYGEAIKNLEVSDFALRRRKPYVQLIDTPLRPLPAIGKSLSKALILSFLFGSVIGGLFIIFRKIVRDALA